MIAKRPAKNKHSKSRPQVVIDRVSATRSKLIAVLIFVLVVATGYLVARSQAAGFFASVDPESGTVSDNAKVVSDSTAYGSKAIQFNAPVVTPPPTTPTPTPGVCTSFPDATCTGIPKGFVPTKVTGDININANGTVVDGKDLTSGIIVINASNVTIKRTIVRGRTGITGNGAFINIQSGTNILIEDVEITSDHPNVGLDGIWGDNVTINRVNIHGGVDGMKIGTNSKVQNSYIHDMNYFKVDPNQNGGPTHNDAIQIADGANILINNNRLMAAGTDPNAAIQVAQDDGVVTGLKITNNFMDYGGCILNVAHKDLAALAFTASGNRFGRHTGYANCAILLSTKSSFTGTGNVWDDNGQIVPVQQHN